MSRLASKFTELGKTNRAALVTFITAGDPAPDITVPLMHTLVEAGSDVIELGVPFSDPMADGPVIQAASERALAAGVATADVIEMIRSFREKNTATPVVLMGYLNPVEIMGYENFASSIADAGADGIIIVDMPPEEGVELGGILKAHGIDNVHLLAPTSTPERVRLICDDASGFIYYVSLRGVTGAATMDLAEVRSRLDHIRTRTGLPLGVGFGIDSATAAGQVAEFADAVIVGSALVRIVAENADDPGVMMQKASDFTRGLSNAVHRAERK